MRASTILALLTSTIVAGYSDAASTTRWEMNTYEDFSKGKFHQVSLDSDGRLKLAPKLETVFASDQPAIWSIAQGPDGRLYLGTGHRGHVYEVTGKGQSRILWSADEPEVFAVAVGPDGSVYAGTSPRGKIYRIANRRAQIYFDPQATYIWALAFGPDGALYAATGDPACVYRITASQQGERLYDTGQGHVTSLAFDSQGHVLAGTEPNGIVYRILGKDKAFVLHDGEYPEIRSIVATRDGSIYLAFLGGSVKKAVTAAESPPAPATQVVAPPTTITVTAAQEGIEIKPPKVEVAKPASPPAAPLPSPPATEVTGVEKSALYRIQPDHTTEKLWSSRQENAYDLLVAGDRLIFSTDRDGRVYQLDRDRKLTLIAETGESEAVRLLRTADGLYVATTNMGKIFRLATGYSDRGVYESPVHDAGSVARWGRLSWKLQGCPGCRVEFQTRSGNTARPDSTWSDWSGPLTDANGSPVSSPNARYIQWRAVFTGPGHVTPVVESVTLAYLPQNNPPRLESLTIKSQTRSAPASTATTSSSSADAFTVTVTATGSASTSTAAGTPTQRLERTLARELELSWQAEDPDGDELVYQIYFRGEGEQTWKLVKADLREQKWTLDSEALADGRYYFKVVASDAPSNPPERARTTELISSPVLIDHTPPQVHIREVQRTPEGIHFLVEAQDSTSPLLRCMYSVDAGQWVVVEADDGVTDSPAERFPIKLSGLAPGEHLLVVRVLDAARNVGVARYLIR